MSTILKNNTARVIILGGGQMLIPEKPITFEMSSAELGSTYPLIKTMLDNGQLAVLNETQAAVAEKELADKTVAELKAYAEENGIDISGLTKKDDVLAAIQKAKG